MSVVRCHLTVLASYLEWLLKQKEEDPAIEGDWIYTLKHYLAKAK